MTPADVPPNRQLTGMSALTNHTFKTNKFVFSPLRLLEHFSYISLRA